MIKTKTISHGSNNPCQDDSLKTAVKIEITYGYPLAGIYTTQSILIVSSNYNRIQYYRLDVNMWYQLTVSFDRTNGRLTFTSSDSDFVVTDIHVFYL